MEKQMSIPQLRFPEFKDNWDKHNLGEIANFSKGKGISKADIVVNGANECIRYGELYTTYGETIDEVISRTNIDVSDLVFSEANDVIIPASGETQIDIATASCVLREGIALGGDLNIIKTQNNGVFLSYYLNYKKKLDIASLAQGISVVHLYSSQLSLLELNLPSKSEQDKVVLFIRSIDEKLKSLKKKENLLDHYKKGLLQKLFSQELRFKDENGKEFADWEEKMLGNIVEIKKGEQLNKEELTETGAYPCINGGISPSGYTNNFNSLENTITISEGGNSCGYINYFNTKFWSGGHNYTLNIIDKSQIDNIFLYQALKENETEIMKLRVGSGLPNIQKKDLSAYIIKFPKSLVEQITVANFLRSIDKKINETNSRIKQSEQWKIGLLQKMFC